MSWLVYFPFLVYYNDEGNDKERDKKDKIKRNANYCRQSSVKNAPNEVLCRFARYIALKDTLPSLATKFSEQ